jgi:hypothetical protein
MDAFPRTMVGDASVSRMIIGTNWFLGYSHTSVAKDSFIKSYQDAKKVAGIMETFLGYGIDTLIGPPDPMLIDAVNEAQDRTGTEMILILTPTFNIIPGGPKENDAEPVFDMCKRYQCKICMPHMMVTDDLLDRMNGEIRNIERYTAMIRERGMIPALSTHMPETIIIADKTKADIETYIQIYNAVGFLMPVEPEWEMQIIKNAHKPVIAIKPLAAGRLSPLTGLPFVWSTIRNKDMVAIGTTTADEAKEVIEISFDILSRQIPEITLQRTRSKTGLEEAM